LDAFDVLDVDFVGDWTFLLWNSSLYVNHGDEWSWYLAADVQRLPEGNIWAVAIDVIGQEIFLATSTGLYKSALAGMWEWQAVIELPEVFLLTAVDNSQVYYFVSYDESINESAIYRWQVGQLPELMGTLKEPPIQLAPDPNPNQKRVYVLNFSGQVWVITPPPESAPRLLGNELFFALNLLTVPNLVAEPYHQLWLADELGLFQYRLNLD
jgi:hypothetical protein